MNNTSKTAWGHVEYITDPYGRLVLQRIGKPRDFAMYQVLDTLPRAVALSASATRSLWGRG